MDRLEISLPDEVQAIVDEQIADGRYADIGDYVGTLIREDARRRAQEKLDALLLEGLEGEATPWIEADVERLRQLARRTG